MLYVSYTSIKLEKQKKTKTEPHLLSFWESFSLEDIEEYPLYYIIMASLDCKEIKPVTPKGDPPWLFIGKIDAKGEAPVLWPPDGNSQLIGEDPDAGKDWRQKKRAAEDEMVR